LIHDSVFGAETICHDSAGPWAGELVRSGRAALFSGLSINLFTEELGHDF
jgi:hypothetical protein